MDTILSQPENVGYAGFAEISVKDKNGKTKKLWQENSVGKFLRTSLGLDLQGFVFLGKWVNTLKMKNTTTNTGFAAMASRCNGDGAETAFTYLAVGTGSTGSAAGDTALEAEITTGGLARASATASRVTTTQTNDTAQLVHTWTSSATHLVTELGTLNAASTGVLLGRQVFGLITIVSGDTIQLTHKFKFS